MMTSPAPTFRGRLWCWTRRLLKVATLVVLAAVPAAYFGAPVLARQEGARRKVESALSRAFGTPVEIASMSFTWKDGLTIVDFRSIALKADSLRIQPDFRKLVRGKSAGRVVLENPDVAVLDSSAGAEFRLPKFCRKGMRFDDVQIRNGSYTVMRADGTRVARITGISSDGAGRLAGRSIDLTLTSFTASFNGLALTGRGALQVTQEGVTGELEVKEPAAAQSSDLKDALRVLKITLKQAEPETRWY